eukprot:359379-Chlamydomonas_euryale.AAC.3
MYTCKHTCARSQSPLCRDTPATNGMALDKECQSERGLEEVCQNLALSAPNALSALHVHRDLSAVSTPVEQPKYLSGELMRHGIAMVIQHADLAAASPWFASCHQGFFIDAASGDLNSAAVRRAARPAPERSASTARLSSLPSCWSDRVGEDVRGAVWPFCCSWCVERRRRLPKDGSGQKRQGGGLQARARVGSTRALVCRRDGPSPT